MTARNNLENGEVGLEVGDASYILRFGTREKLKLEDHYGMGVAKLGDYMGSEDFVTMRNVVTLMEIGLSRHHDDLSEDEVADLIDAAGDLEGLMDLIATAFAAGFQGAGGDPSGKKQAKKAAKKKAKKGPARK